MPISSINNEPIKLSDSVADELLGMTKSKIKMYATTGTASRTHTVTYPLMRGYWKDFDDPTGYSLKLLSAAPMVYIPKGFSADISLDSDFQYTIYPYGTDGTRVNANEMCVYDIDGTQYPENYSTGSKLHINPIEWPIVLDIRMKRVDGADVSTSDTTLEIKLTDQMQANGRLEGSGIAETLLSMVERRSLTASSTNANTSFWDSGLGTAKSGYNLYRFSTGGSSVVAFTMSGDECRAVFKPVSSMARGLISSRVIEGAGTYVMAVPDGASYLAISTKADEEYGAWSVVDSLIGGYVVGGPVFMFMSGDMLHVMPTADSRALINGQIRNISSWGGSYEVTKNHLWSVALGKDGFKVVPETDLSYGDNPLAICYVNRGEVFAVSDNVYTDCLPLSRGYKRQDVPYWLNNKKLYGYRVRPRGGNSQVSDYGYFYAVRERYGTVCFDYVGKDDDCYYSDLILTKNTASIASKKILCIGDSFTARGWYQTRIASYEPTVQFLGTRATYHDDHVSEGYSGARSYEVLESATISTPSGNPVVNPFWDADAGEVSFEYYCTMQNVHPDYVLIEFGLNESDHARYASAVQGFIDKVKAYDSSIIVYVIQPMDAVTSIGSKNYLNPERFSEHRKCVLETYSFTDCVLIPCWYVLVDEYDYDTEEVTYEYSDQKIVVATDGVHPHSTTGFYKLGDQIYNYLGVTENASA